MTAITAAGLAAAPAVAAAPGTALGGNGTPARVIVLGDSLSDTGNAGRFSNGRIWVETVAKELGAELKPSERGGTNYAVGGARLYGGVHSLRRQADQYLAGLAGGRVPEGALHIVYGGGNDLLAAPLAPNINVLVRDAIASLRSILEDLAARGAGDVLVPNLPNVGLAPYVRMLGPQVGALALGLTQDYNRSLSRMLDEVEGRHPGMRIHRLDVFQLAVQVMDDPARAGYRDVTSPCPQQAKQACEGYLFWDGLHPTALAHEQLAGAALEALERGTGAGRRAAAR